MFVEDERGEPDEDDLVTMIFVRYKTSSDEITAFNGLTANIDGILVNALMFTGSAMGYLPEDTSAIESMELVYYAIPAGDAMTLITSVMQNGPVVDLTGYEQVGCAYDITSFKDTFFPST